MCSRTTHTSQWTSLPLFLVKLHVSLFIPILYAHEVLVDQTSKTVIGLRDTCSSVRVIMFFCRVATTACQSLIPHTGVDHLLGVATNGRIIFFLLFLVDTRGTAPQTSSYTDGGLLLQTTIRSPNKLCQLLGRINSPVHQQL